MVCSHASWGGTILALKIGYEVLGLISSDFLQAQLHRQANRYVQPHMGRQIWTYIRRLIPIGLFPYPHLSQQRSPFDE
jgi:hypothetical protein